VSFFCALWKRPATVAAAAATISQIAAITHFALRRLASSKMRLMRRGGYAWRTRVSATAGVH
jgi:hypothetical protein